MPSRYRLETDPSSNIESCTNKTYITPFLNKDKTEILYERRTDSFGSCIK